MCSLHLTHPSAHTLGAVCSRNCGAREHLGIQCLAQGPHLSRDSWIIPAEPRFEPTTSGYKSDALSIRATTANYLFTKTTNYQQNTIIVLNDF